MGYLTTFTIYNDSAHILKELTPKEAEDLVLRLYNGCVIGKEHDISLNGHVNAIHVQRCRHADDTMIYIHMGNCLSEFNPYTNTIKHPDVMVSQYKLVKEFLKQMEKTLLENGIKVT